LVRAFAAGRLADLCPDAVAAVGAMTDVDLRRLYAAVRRTRTETLLVP